MSEQDLAGSSAHLAGIVAGIGAQRLGADTGNAGAVEQAVEAIVGAILRHHDPAALARDPGLALGMAVADRRRLGVPLRVGHEITSVRRIAIRMRPPTPAAISRYEVRGFDRVRSS